MDETGLRVSEVGPEAAEDWTSVHWSSFKGTPYKGDDKARFAARWAQMMTGPFADRAHSLIAHDGDDAPVAVTRVWSAGPGRPGLVEPMGVHRSHHGKGYGVAITLAGARALQERGASSVVVVAEGSNPAALATYRSAGFSGFGDVSDLKRP
ncbi:GNAT family N-acetyltransferase [Arsenicicoccus cauae]|uniref:GNAT family N-acetyltransferase n=1 Tax=Arsenicicoccus cauae TaxID=2663847 RepID=UPI00370D1548